MSSKWKHSKKIQYISPLSSFAWERNFSVVNSGFFSSNIRFQKLENFDSVETQSKTLHIHCVLQCIGKGNKVSLEGTASPVWVSNIASRLRRTEAATPSASKACWEFCATAFSRVWRSKDVKSEAWASVSPNTSTYQVNRIYLIAYPTTYVVGKTITFYFEEKRKDNIEHSTNTLLKYYSCRQNAVDCKFKAVTNVNTWVK